MNFKKVCKEVTFWGALSVFMGVLGGFVGALFSNTVLTATAVRTGNQWLVWLLPIAGLLSVALYKLLKVGSTGTVAVFDAAHKEKSIPIFLAPAVFCATALTHLCGGSAGKEGAALQIGGGLTAVTSKIFKLSAKRQKTLVLCSLSALFSAVFGTPLAAAVFAVEAPRIKKQGLWQVVPCIVSSFAAFFVAHLLGVEPERFGISNVYDTSLVFIAVAVVIAVLSAMVGEAFCYSLRYSGKFFKKIFKNEYLRIFIGALAVALIPFALGTYEYNGSSIDVLHNIFAHSQVKYEAFAIKFLLTVITVSVGFKGGQIVPSLFMGAALGGAVALLFGVSVPLGAAIGVAAFFCAVTNCTLASILLCLEVFSGSQFGFLAAAVIIARLVSGRINLYGETPSIFRKK